MTYYNVVTPTERKVQELGNFLIIETDGVEHIWAQAGAGIERFIGGKYQEEERVVVFFDALFAKSHEFSGNDDVAAWVKTHPDKNMRLAWKKDFALWFEFFEEDLWGFKYSDVLKYMKMYLAQHFMATA